LEDQICPTLQILQTFIFVEKIYSQPKLIMSREGRQCKWIANGVKGFLLDVYGVLYDSGSSDVPIPGSIEAVKK